MKNYFFPHLEWEALRQPVTFSKIDQNDRLPKKPKEIKISRDEEYNLKAFLEFEITSSDEENIWKKHVVKGSVKKPFYINSSSHGISYTLESVLIGSVNVIKISNEIIKNEGRAELFFNALKIEYSSTRKGTHFVEWYLNGPNEPLFWDKTEREQKINFIRKRSDSENTEKDSIKNSTIDSDFAADCMWIELPKLQFLIEKVPNEFGPKWSSNIAIEFREEWGGIPSREDRVLIEEVCSFIFGRQLLSIGYTIFDKTECLVEAYCHNPWGRNAKSFCSKVSYPPIKIIFPPSKIKQVIFQLLPKYLELSNSLCLTEALWNIWVSREMPIGTNLPILAAALESIMNGWFKSKSKTHGAYLPKNDFLDLVETDFDLIRIKLEQYFEPKDNYKVEKIIDKLKRGNDFGVMEKYRIFFDEINLKIEPHEWRAIIERHKFVHGEARFNNTDWDKVMVHVNTYETLLNKVLLKLLGYSGSYIDRSVQGLTEKQLM
ncbi:MAG: hypothetical protein ACOWW1_08055 [archaeon]